MTEQEQNRAFKEADMLEIKTHDKELKRLKNKIQKAFKELRNFSVLDAENFLETLADKPVGGARLSLTITNGCLTDVFSTVELEMDLYSVVTFPTPVGNLGSVSGEHATLSEKCIFSTIEYQEKIQQKNKEYEEKSC